MRKLILAVLVAAATACGGEGVELEVTRHVRTIEDGPDLGCCYWMTMKRFMPEGCTPEYIENPDGSRWLAAPRCEDVWNVVTE